MAVEARRLDLFSPQLLTNRELLNPIESNGGLYGTQTGYGVVSSTADTVPFPMHGTTDYVPADPFTSQILNPSIDSVDSSFGINNGNYNLPLLTRKRTRDSLNNAVMVDHTVLENPKSCAPFSFLGQDISSQIQQQQLDIDRLIAIHMERVRIQLEAKRKRQARTIMEAVGQGLMKKLRAKEEERENIGKLNHALVERVKSLCIENQIWRDLAQTNEATANALRTNLEQVLGQVKDVRTTGAGLDEVADDAQSFCGSSCGDEELERRTLAAEEAKDKDIGKKRKGCGEGTSRTCRNCGEEESCVLLLPCRHLCLCAVCGSNLHTCPVCKSPKNASVHVNLSS